MSILTDDIVIHKGDLYENINVIITKEGQNWGYIDYIARTVLNECPLDKWPEWAEKAVKSHLLAHNGHPGSPAIEEFDYITIVEKPHPFVDYIVQIDFCLRGGTIFVAYCNKKEEAPKEPPPGMVYARYIPVPTTEPAIGINHSERCIQPQGLREVPILPDLP